VLGSGRGTEEGLTFAASRDEAAWRRAMMNEDGDRRTVTATADVFNPTKVCELRLGGARGWAPGKVSKKDYVLPNGAYSLGLARSAHPVLPLSL